MYCLWRLTALFTPLVLSLAYCSVTRKQVSAKSGFGFGQIWFPKFGQIRLRPNLKKSNSVQPYSSYDVVLQQLNLMMNLTAHLEKNSKHSIKIHAHTLASCAANDGFASARFPATWVAYKRRCRKNNHKQQIRNLKYKRYKCYICDEQRCKILNYK